MGMHLGRNETILIALILRRSLVFDELTLLRGLGLLRILLALLLFRFVPILGSSLIS